MKTVVNYLDELKERTGSDNKTATLLEIDRASISNIRRRQLMSDETAIKVADALGIDEAEVLIAAAMARSDGAVLKAWQRIYKAMGVAASFLLIIQGVNYALLGENIHILHIM